MLLLNNPKDKEAIQQVMRDGKTTEFWHLICQSLQESVEYLLREQDGEEMLNLPASEYKVMAEVLRAKRANLKKLQELPDTIIGFLENPAPKQENFDPYYTEAHFNKT